MYSLSSTETVSLDCCNLWWINATDLTRLLLSFKTSFIFVSLVRLAWRYSRPEMT